MRNWISRGKVLRSGGPRMIIALVMEEFGVRDKKMRTISNNFLMQIRHVYKLFREEEFAIMGFLSPPTYEEGKLVHKIGNLPPKNCVYGCRRQLDLS